jgi:hypothetical protein
MKNNNTVVETISSLAFEIAFLKLFLVERNLVGEYAEWSNERVALFNSFNELDLEKESEQ